MMYVCLISNSDDLEPRAKQSKLDDADDLSGGLTSVLKTKVTEVHAFNNF